MMMHFFKKAAQKRYTPYRVFSGVFFFFVAISFVISPIALAGSAEIFSYGSNGSDPSAAGSGMVNLNSYGSSSVTIDVSSNAYAGSQSGGGRNYSGYAEAVIGTSVVKDDVPNGSDPMQVAAGNTITINKDAFGNWIYGGVNVGSSISIAGSASVNGENSEGNAGTSGWVYWVNATVGNINVSSNIAAGSYTLTGPAILSGSGVSNSHANQPTGGYTITWNDVPGYTKPGSNSQTLTSGGTISFSGNYSVIVAPPVTINVSF